MQFRKSRAIAVAIPLSVISRWALLPGSAAIAANPFQSSAGAHLCKGC